MEENKRTLMRRKKNIKDSRINKQKEKENNEPRKKEWQKWKISGSSAPPLSQVQVIKMILILVVTKDECIMCICFTNIYMSMPHKISNTSVFFLDITVQLSYYLHMLYGTWEMKCKQLIEKKKE